MKRWSSNIWKWKRKHNRQQSSKVRVNRLCTLSGSSYLLGTLRISAPAFLTRTAITFSRKDKMSEEVCSLPTDTAGAAVTGGSIMVVGAGRIIICFLEKGHYLFLMVCFHQKTPFSWQKAGKQLWLLHDLCIIAKAQGHTNKHNIT